MHGLAQTSKIQFMQPCKKKKENLPRIDSKVSKKVNVLTISKCMGILLFKSKGGKGGGWVKSEFIFIFNPMHELCDMYSTIHHYE